MKKRMVVLLCATVFLFAFPRFVHATGDFLVPLNDVVDVELAERPGNVMGTAANKEQFNELLQKGLRSLDTDFIIHYTGSDIRELFRELNANPGGKYFYGVEGYQWNMKNAQFSAKGKTGNFPVRLKIDYHHTAAEEKFLNAKVEKVLRKLIKPEMTPLQKIDAVHDYIVLTSTYTRQTKRSPHSAYTLVTEGGGVCQAYSTLGYRMLERLGFEVCMVHGVTDEPHSWLRVKLDDKWYNLDITYDDPVPNRKNEVQYRHAMVSDAQLVKTHRLTAGVPFPEATSTKYDVRNDGHAKKYTDSELQVFLNIFAEN